MGTLNILADSGAWILALSNKFDLMNKAIPQGVKDKLPMFLTLSDVDESRWAKYFSQLDKDDGGNYKDLGEQAAILKFIDSNNKDLSLRNMTDYERNHFRYIVVGIPADEKKTESGKDKDKKVTIVQVDCATRFLKDLARVINTQGLPAANRQCRLGGSLKEPVHEVALKKWREGTNWFKKNILEPLEVQDLAGLKTKLESLNTSVTKGIGQLRKVVQAITKEAEDNPKNKGFLGEFGWFFGKNNKKQI